MKRIVVSAAALLLSACATSQTPAASVADATLRVIEPDASIALASSSIDGFTDGPGQSMLINTRGGGLYRVMLRPPCRGEAGFAEHAALEAGGTDTFDKFSTLRINGRVCNVSTIDRVERVKPS